MYLSFAHAQIDKVVRIRFRIGPFTFGSGGTRFSPWSGGTGFSVPLSNNKAASFAKIKLGIFSFLFNNKSKKAKCKEVQWNEKLRAIKTTYEQAYEPWSTEADEKLIKLFHQGKSVNELSETFGRTSGAIRSRINKLLFK